MQPARVLYCVLNWGLGHATRSIPVIDELLSCNAQVVIASDGEALAFLCSRYPDLDAAVLPSYKIRYSTFMVLEMLRSLPRIRQAIRKEHLVTQNLVNRYRIDRIISDNRYGCYHDSLPSAFITHQVGIKCPKGLKWLEPFLFRLHKSRIEKFTDCWIPDVDGETNLSGELAHGHELKSKRFIGTLSHIKNYSPVAGEPIPVLVICSGPEPARTRFEKMLVDELERASVQAVMVRGTGKPSAFPYPANITVNHLCSSEELSALIHRAQIIISRSGYSTLMDLVSIRKKAILIPTPGQTEQEYLAGYHLSKGNFFSVRQRDFSFQKALEGVNRYSPPTLPENNLLKETIKSFLS